MKYIILKYYYWFRNFGIKGLLVVIHRNSNTLECRTLSSEVYGSLLLRDCLSDIEAVNTVMCFEAYKPGAGLSRCKSLIDLGANIGMATMYFRAHFPKARIVAVEPSELNAEIFKENLKCDMEGGIVTLVEAAVGVTEGTGVLVDVGENRFDSFQITESHNLQGAHPPVQIVSMNRLVGICEQPIGVKMDIEGSEVELLENRAGWIGEVSYLMIEFHNRGQEDRWVKMLQAEGWVARKQFDTWHFRMPDSLS